MATESKSVTMAQVQTVGLCNKDCIKFQKVVLRLVGEYLENKISDTDFLDRLRRQEELTLKCFKAHGLLGSERELMRFLTKSLN